MNTKNNRKSNIPKKEPIDRNKILAWILAGLIIFWTVASVFAFIAYGRTSRKSASNVIKASASTAHDYGRGELPLDLPIFDGMAFGDGNGNTYTLWGTHKLVLGDGFTAYNYNGNYYPISADNNNLIEGTGSFGYTVAPYSFRVRSAEDYTTNFIRIWEYISVDYRSFSSTEAGFDYSVQLTVNTSAGIGDESSHIFYVDIKLPQPSQPEVTAIGDVVLPTGTYVCYEDDLTDVLDPLDYYFSLNFNSLGRSFGSMGFLEEGSVFRLTFYDQGDDYLLVYANDWMNYNAKVIQIVETNQVLSQEAFQLFSSTYAYLQDWTTTTITGTFELFSSLDFSYFTSEDYDCLSFYNSDVASLQVADFVFGGQFFNSIYASPDPLASNYVYQYIDGAWVGDTSLDLSIDTWYTSADQYKYFNFIIMNSNFISSDVPDVPDDPDDPDVPSTIDYDYCIIPTQSQVGMFNSTALSGTFGGYGVVWEDFLFYYDQYSKLYGGYDLGFGDGYKAGKSDGYNEGYAVGENKGYADGREVGYRQGKNDGFLEGVEDANEYSFGGLISAVFDSPIRAFTSLFNFEILGVNLAGFFLSLLTIAVILCIVRLVL